MSKIELYLSKIVKYGLYAVLLTPLAFWPRALYGFMTPKFLLFQVLVEIVFGAWLILKIIDFRNRGIFDFGNQLFGRKNYISLALLGFFAVSLISALFGVDSNRSVWGIGARMTGLFAEFHFLAWFLMLITAFSNTNTRIDTNNTNKNSHHSCVFVNSYYYLNFSFAVSIILALTAFYQNIPWHIVYGYTTFSNPTFVAPYFLFHFFWGLCQSIDIGCLSRRLYFLGGSILIVVALILGQVRGAMIGLFVGVLIVSIFLAFSNILRKNHRILIAIFLVLVILSVAPIFIFKDSKFIKSNIYLDRIGSISLSAITAQTRILTWQSAINGFFDRPIFGVGPENFNYLFNAHYNPRLLMYGGNSFAETWQDKPHNTYLEILTEIGIVGGLSYILLWLCVAYCLFKIFSARGGSASGGKKDDKFLSIILAGAFISYLVSMILSFDSFGSWFGLYLMFGFLASLTNTNVTNRLTNDTNVNQKFIKIFVPFVCLFVLFVLLYVNYAIWRANLADADALRTFPVSPATGVELFKKSLSYKSPYKSEYQFDLIASVSGAIEKNIPINNLEVIVNFVLNEADKAISVHPKNAGSYTDMARIYNILGTLGRDPEILAQAELFGRKSLELSPNRQETLFYLARTALLENKPNIALEWARQALATDPAVRVSHWYMGLALIANSQINEGVLEIKKALDLGYQPRNDAEKNFIKNLGI